MIRIRRTLTTGLTLLFFGWSSVVVAESVTTARRERSQLECEPIARVVNNGDRHYQAKSFLCSGDRLQPVPNKSVEVLCYASGNFLQLKTSTTITTDKCRTQAEKVSPCTPGNPSLCKKTRGPEAEDNRPTLISPYSSSILDNRPELSWYAVKGATSYTVQFNGEGISWQKTVTDTKLTYPTHKPGLRAGSVAKVIIVANSGKSYLSESNAILNVLAASEANQVLTAIERIKSLNLSADETAFDLNAVYRSQDLLTEAINTLKTRISAGSNNPVLYRVLGDRYLEAGLPDYAKQEFTTAATLAQKADNEAELALAQAGLRRASLHSQLPTRINGDQ